MPDRYGRRLSLALRVLETAAGRPVTFAELERAGVEHPAQTVYELEVAGEAIVHTPTGVRLDPVSGQSSRRTQSRGRWRAWRR